MLAKEEALRQVSRLDVWRIPRALIMRYGALIDRMDTALTEWLHSQGLDRLSADAEPIDAEPRSYV
jgi:hypothetical protein